MQAYVKDILKILYENIISFVIMYRWEYMGGTNSIKFFDICVEENKHFTIKIYHGACNH